MNATPSHAVPRVIGHRGAAGHAPENTVVSVVTAARLGAQWVEFDAKLSRDGCVVVFHDDDLERTTNGTGPIAEVDMADLEGLDAGGWFRRRFAGEPIPTLNEMLGVLEAYGLGANVEIKPSPGREAETGGAVARMLAESWPASLPPPVISSFSVRSLAAAREAAPGIERAVLYLGLPKDWRDQAEALQCRTLHCSREYLTEPQARAVKAAGFTLRMFTVNNRRTARKLFGWGADAVISDFPDRMLAL